MLLLAGGCDYTDILVGMGVQGRDREVDVGLRLLHEFREPNLFPQDFSPSWLTARGGESVRRRAKDLGSTVQEETTAQPSSDGPVLRGEASEKLSSLIPPLYLTRFPPTDRRTPLLAPLGSVD
jgi:hypothetical protein